MYEYVGRRNLPQVLNDVELERVDFPRRHGYAREVGSALEYCHRMGVLHLDVKATNVLLTDPGQQRALFLLLRIETRTNY